MFHNDSFVKIIKVTIRRKHKRPFYNLKSAFLWYILFHFIYLFCPFFFRVAPSAYGGSQARGQNLAVPMAYITARATSEWSHICDLQHRSWQYWILNPLSRARDGTCVLMDASSDSSPLSRNGNSHVYTILLQIFSPDRSQFSKVGKGISGFKPFLKNNISIYSFFPNITKFSELLS